MFIKKCLSCGRDFNPSKKIRKFCSHICYAKSKIGKPAPHPFQKGHKSWSKGLKLPQISGENSPFWKERIIKSCTSCGKKFSVIPGKFENKFCSQNCYWKSCKGIKGRHWKGGISEMTDGSIRIWNPKHPLSSKQGYMPIHRIIAEKYLNRYLEKTEVIHHINFNKKNNQVENLYLFPNQSEHCKFHSNPYPLTSNII